jgi:hypothetical protein
MLKILRRIEIEELDTGYKITTDVRLGIGPCTMNGGDKPHEEKLRKEMAVDKLQRVLKVVKTYLGADLEENKEED